MPTIAVLNQKGGAGKTTTALGVADALTNMLNTVLLVDTDERGSSLKWASVREQEPKFGVVGMPHDKIHRDLPPIALPYAYTIIDGFPKMDNIARSAIMASDLVLIPVQPSPLDIWAAEDTVRLVKDALIYKPMLKCAFVIERKITGTVLGKSVAAALERYELPVMKTEIHQRVAYAMTLIQGLTLSEADTEGSAADEMAALAVEIKAFMEWK